MLVTPARTPSLAHSTAPTTPALEPPRLLQGPVPGRIYPFSAIVGQDDLKLALILTVIDPLIGGVVAMGHRGTGKSTAVRALAQLLPPLPVVRGCRFHCDPDQPHQWCSECTARFGDPGAVNGGVSVDGHGSRNGHGFPERDYVATPVVDMPLGTTEDRLLGSLDLEKALRQGIKAFEPGLLAQAHRGFLYIDEINLLDDALIDRLLDVAASGVNVVEREGISLRHPSRFVLVGSGNPEEGDLRPQLLDRFGLYVPVTTPVDIDQRVEILRRREQFERDPQGFARSFAPREERLRRRLQAARQRLPHLAVSTPLLRQIATLCARLELDGHRGELTLARAAAALAAWEGEDQVTARHVARLAPMALQHRLRRDPLDTGEPLERIEEEMAALGLEPAGPDPFDLPERQP